MSFRSTANMHSLVQERSQAYLVLSKILPAFIYPLSATWRREQRNNERIALITRMFSSARTYQKCFFYSATAISIYKCASPNAHCGPNSLLSLNASVMPMKPHEHNVKKCLAHLLPRNTQWICFPFSHLSSGLPVYHIRGSLGAWLLYKLVFVYFLKTEFTILCICICQMYLKC